MLSDFQAQLGRPFEHKARLKELLTKQAELNAALDLDKNERQVAPEEAGEPEDCADDAHLEVIPCGQHTRWVGNSAEAKVTDHRIEPADVKRARKAFEANEPRDLFYRAATELVDLTLRHKTSLTVAEAFAMLLQTWNKAYYQYRKFDNTHFAKIETLLSAHQAALAGYRNQSIDDVKPQEKVTFTNLFQAFEKVLGPVGAAKALHLLAPRIFPLWDRAIAEAYDVALGEAGSNRDRYWRFVLISQRQCEELRRADPECRNPLKSIDEFNYCKHTKKWL